MKSYEFEQVVTRSKGHEVASYARKICSVKFHNSVVLESKLDGVISKKMTVWNSENWEKLHTLQNYRTNFVLSTTIKRDTHNTFGVWTKCEPRSRNWFSETEWTVLEHLRPRFNADSHRHGSSHLTATAGQHQTSTCYRRQHAAESALTNYAISRNFSLHRSKLFTSVTSLPP